MNIKMLLLDVDGVLTDGSIMIDSAGREQKRFHVRDGMGLVVWQNLGLTVGILTGRPSVITTHRAMELGVEWIEQGHAMDKVIGYENLCRRAMVTDDEVAFMADDLADLPVLARVGYPIAVADAAEAVREEAAYVTQTPGGHGAVREVVEHLLKQMGRWDEVLERYQL